MSTKEDHRQEILIEAPASAVYEALTSTAEIARWWTAEAQGSSEVGGTFRVTFGDNGWTELRVDRLDPDAVEWTCTAQDIRKFTPHDEWVGTRMVFHLSEANGTTRLDFVHHGLRPLDCLEMCEVGWDKHLGSDLKRLVETGIGIPNSPVTELVEGAAADNRPR